MFYAQSISIGDDPSVFATPCGQIGTVAKWGITWQLHRKIKLDNQGPRCFLFGPGLAVGSCAVDIGLMSLARRTTIDPVSLSIRPDLQHCTMHACVKSKINTNDALGPVSVRP